MLSWKAPIAVGLRPRGPLSRTHFHSLVGGQSSSTLYATRTRLDVLFRPEAPLSETVDPLELEGLEQQNDLSTEWRNPFTPLTVSIIEAYTPFTTSVVLVAEPLDPPPSITLPERFIIKLNDRRCGDRNDYDDLNVGWKPTVEPRPSGKCLVAIVPRRADRRSADDPFNTINSPSAAMSAHGRPALVLLGEVPARLWFFSRCLSEGLRTFSDPHRTFEIPYEFRGSFPGPYDVRSPTLFKDWMWEIYSWQGRSYVYYQEVLDYRHLRSLQGACLPRLYGTVRLPLPPLSASDFHHPATLFVQGLAVELIPGRSMASLKVGEDVTKEEAEVAAHRVMDVVATIQARDCSHNDMRLPNIILRNWPDEIDPVLIDFGCAVLEEPDDGSQTVGYYDEVEQARGMLERPDSGPWIEPLPVEYVGDEDMPVEKEWMLPWMKEKEEEEAQEKEDRLRSPGLKQQVAEDNR
ncbi:hypothetical protein C8R44DRAFT_993015 [Mycena epipterygia]|nr:hypothetical protein C8R44DRAFT_993015 [Mycena epipterygia]